MFPRQRRVKPRQTWRTRQVASAATKNRWRKLAQKTGKNMRTSIRTTTTATTWSGSTKVMELEVTQPTDRHHPRIAHAVQFEVAVKHGQAWVSNRRGFRPINCPWYAREDLSDPPGYETWLEFQDWCGVTIRLTISRSYSDKLSMRLAEVLS